MLTLRNPEELSTFLRRHPGAPRLAREAADRLPAYFPGDPIVLGVEIDPEDAQEPVLFVVVRTGLDPKTALATLNRFDREWWLPARGRTDLPLRVTIEPVCRVRRPRVLRLAGGMLPISSDEAAARTVVGRASYADYHAGRRYLESVGSTLSRGSSGHKQLADILGRDDETIVESLDRLRRLRKAADYDTATMTRPARTASIAVPIASEIIDAIDDEIAERT